MLLRKSNKTLLLKVPKRVTKSSDSVKEETESDEEVVADWVQKVNEMGHKDEMETSSK